MATGDDVKPRMTHIRRRRQRSHCAGPLRLSGAAVVLSVLFASQLNAQQTTSQPGDTPQPAPSTDLPVGNVVTDDDIPPYHFSPLKLTGRVSPDGKRAQLRAEIEVHINHAIGAYDVPLRLTQAAVTAVEYEGPMQPIPYQPEGPDDGVHWYFRGAGRHRLVLDLDIGLRSTPTGTNLQLTLPSGSRFFPSQLMLSIPEPDLIVEPGENNTVRSLEQVDQETVVTTVIEGTRLDLAWRPADDRGGSVAGVRTSIAIDQSNDALRLQALQEIVVIGAVTELRVRLPEQFRLVDLTGESYVSHTQDSDGPDWVRVQVAPDEQSQVELKWTFSDASGLTPGALLVDGFEVDGAARQTGTIGIAPIRGFNIQRLLSGEEDGLTRHEPRNARPVGGVSFYRWAWRFDRQPFRLDLAVRNERAWYDVRTRAAITVFEDRTLLDLDYQVQVHSGALREIVLKWPAPSRADWSLQEVSEGVRVTDATDEHSPFPGELQRLEFTEPEEGNFSVRLQFQRTHSAGPFELAIPQAVTERTLPAWLLIRGVDAVEPELDEAGDLELLTESAADDWLSGENYRPQRDQAYRIVSDSLVLTGVARVYELQLDSSTHVVVSRAESDTLHVRQSITTDVRYGRVQELVFGWPAEFPQARRASAAAGLLCRMSDGTPLACRGDDRNLFVTLPEPMHGAIKTTIEYRWPLSTDLQHVDLPIFVPADRSHSSTVVEFPSSGSFSIKPDDSDWDWIPTSLQPSWTAVRPTDVFEANLSFDVSSAPQRYEIALALQRAAYDRSGHVRIRVDYDLRNAPGRVVLQLPAQAEPAGVWWRGSKLGTGVVVAEASDSLRVEIEVADQSHGNSGWLSLEYRWAMSRPLAPLQEFQAAFPIVPEGVLVAESYVELGLPSEFCQLTYPQGLTPLVEWRPGLVFQRQLTPRYQETRAQLLGHPELHSVDRTGNHFLDPSGNAHVYAFWSTGGVADLNFKAVSLWMLILVGAGATLGLAFLLWSVPTTRNILTLLVLGSVVALAGVLAAEVVELLLQPVLLGLLAALIAIGLQSQRPAFRDRSASGRSDDRSTRSEPPPGSASGSYAPLPTTQISPREMQESGSRA